MKLKGKGVDAALLDLANDRSIILNEFYSYLESGEIARVYDYMADGYQYNFRHLKRKVIKEDTKTVINWLNKTDDIDIIAKNLVLFVDNLFPSAITDRTFLFDNQIIKSMRCIAPPKTTE